MAAKKKPKRLKKSTKLSKVMNLQVTPLRQH